MQQSDQYVTKDLGETTALLTSGCVMRSIDWKDDTAFFSFDELKKCQEYSHNYFFGELPINARLYYENLRMVKRKLYAEANKKDISVKR